MLREVPKWIKLVFGLWITAEEGNIVLDVGADLGTERVSK